MIKRTILKDVKNHLSKKEMTLITGPRQAGKTTIILAVKDELDKKGEKTVFLNLDIERDRYFFESQAALVKKIELEVGKKRAFIFIDEIQRKENAGLFLKGIYDMNLPYKFILSGSGSIELKEKIHESLTGRKRIFELETLSFVEFLNFKTNYSYENRLADFFEIEKNKANELLDEFMFFGGYPAAVKAETKDEKLNVLNEIYRSYIEKDISYLLGVKKTETFSHLINILASQAGNIVNVSELSSTLGLAAATVKEYLWYIEKTFITKKVTPYFKNIRREITKSPIYYFRDLGLQNFAKGGFSFGDKSENGFSFQNLVFNEIYKKTEKNGGDIHFWRTKNGAEVDIIVEAGNKVIPIEVKWSVLKKPVITRSLQSFIEHYAPKEAYIINREFKKKIKFRNTIIYFTTIYSILNKGAGKDIA